MFHRKLFLLITVLKAAAVTFAQDDLFPVSIVHINDFHARFEETDTSASSCNDGERCIGGYARLVTAVKNLMTKRNATNPIFLNAGDNFQGTLWYTIGKWNVTQHFLNMLPADAMTLGNHEFDHGIEGVVPFLETINSPIVIANVDDSQEPTMQGKYKKSIIIEKFSRKIGIIGVILQTTDEIANTGKLRFTNESEAVKAEAEYLKTVHNVDIIIVLSHCGLDVDRIIAANAGPLIDIIVGGHSHTFLYTGDQSPGPDTPRDTYPVEIIQGNGHKVLIVQASCYAKYVGDITVYFDETGEVSYFEGAPIFLDNDVAPDVDVHNALTPWKEIIDVVGKKEVGESRVMLSKNSCSYAECNIGSFINDAFIHAFAKSVSPFGKYWTSASISLYNVGGIRTTLNKGVLTYSHLITAVPFGNTIDSFDLPGKHIKNALEYSVQKSSGEDNPSFLNMLQLAGLRVTFNISNPVGHRVVNVLVRCQNCTIPIYEQLVPDSMYRVVTSSFLSGGGDGFTMLRDYKQNLVHGAVDIDAVTEYVQMFSPVAVGSDERIVILR